MSQRLSIIAGPIGSVTPEKAALANKKTIIDEHNSTLPLITENPNGKAKTDDVRASERVSRPSVRVARGTVIQKGTGSVPTSQANNTSQNDSRAVNVISVPDPASRKPSISNASQLAPAQRRLSTKNSTEQNVQGLEINSNPKNIAPTVPTNPQASNRSQRSTIVNKGKSQKQVPATDIGDFMRYLINLFLKFVFNSN
jgi:hypothetical protein